MTPGHREALGEKAQFPKSLSSGFQALGTYRQKVSNYTLSPGKDGVRGCEWAGRAWLGKSSGHSGSLRRKQNGTEAGP